jgi:hypothetical protein
MKADFPMVGAMPFYLVIQAVLMTSTFLEFPVYMLAYRAGSTPVTPWVVLLLFLTAAGLVFGVSALARRTWKVNLDAAQRLKLSGGYFLGALAGLVAFGIRFMPVIPRMYFYFVGAFALLLALVFVIFKRRSVRQEELFP